MSAFSDDPDHFERWYGERAGGGGEDFAPRTLYGDYLEQVRAEAGIAVVPGEAVAIGEGGVRLADGRGLAADAVVLAPGNFKPATPRGIDPEALGPLWVDDPWAGDLGEGLGAGDVLLLIGTGLTAVDVALTLDATGYRGRIVALSRRGLAPRAHGTREPNVAPLEDLPPTCVAMLRRVRARSDEIGWRSAVHELRAVTSALWAKADEGERRRFLRHLRAWWDVHRHKVAPAVGATIAAMQADARLAVAAGRLVSAEASDGKALVRFRLRGSDTVESLRAAPDRQLHRARARHRPRRRAFARFAARRGRDPPRSARHRHRRRSGLPGDPRRRDRERDALGDRPGHPRRLLGERRSARHPRPGRARRRTATRLECGIYVSRGHKGVCPFFRSRSGTGRRRPGGRRR